jgi:hypothetical protein
VFFISKVLKQNDLPILNKRLEKRLKDKGDGKRLTRVTAITISQLSRVRHRRPIRRIRNALRRQKKRNEYFLQYTFRFF